MPFLRQELNLSYTLGGVLLTALGIILGSLVSDRAATILNCLDITSGF
jgi:hypothetical protein